MLFFFLSCGTKELNNEEIKFIQNQNLNIESNDLITINETITRVVNYNLSSCKQNCESDSNSLLLSENLGDTLKLKIGILMNSTWKDGVKVTGVISQNDTLDIGIVPIVGGGLGCQCFLYHNIELVNLHTIPKTIWL